MLLAGKMRSSSSTWMSMPCSSSRSYSHFIKAFSLFLTSGSVPLNLDWKLVSWTFVLVLCFFFVLPASVKQMQQWGLFITGIWQPQNVQLRRTLHPTPYRQYGWKLAIGTWESVSHLSPPAMHRAACHLLALSVGICFLHGAAADDKRRAVERELRSYREWWLLITTSWSGVSPPSFN